VTATETYTSTTAERTVATFDASSVVAVFQNLTPDDFDRLVESVDVDVADVIDPNNQNEAENTTNT